VRNVDGKQQKRSENVPSSCTAGPHALLSFNNGIMSIAACAERITSPVPFAEMPKP